MTKMTQNMREAFAREQCGFFDPSMINGGPDPNPELRPNGKPRMRRSTDDQPDGGEPNILAYNKKNRLLGLQQILLGYRYWAERHINECHGQRKFNYISKRGQKLVRHTWWTCSIFEFTFDFRFMFQFNHQATKDILELRGQSNNCRT